MALGIIRTGALGRVYYALMSSNILADAAAFKHLYVWSGVWQGVGYEKVLAMQNQNNLSASEIISTYSYKVSLAASMPDFSYGTAIALFQSLVGLVLITVSNKAANKLTGNGFW